MDLDDDLPVPPLSERMRSWAVTVVLTVVLFFGASQALSWLRAPDLPEQAPAFSLRDVDGAMVSLEQYSGQTVVLNFWATWCAPCKVEAPWFASFSQDHPDVVVLGIAVDGAPPQLRAAGQRLGITYPILVADAATLNAYRPSAYPTTVVVGPDGKVEAVHVGLMTRPQLAWATGKWW
jgi:thiol-disulfide isomerase/thioredoxin